VTITKSSCLDELSKTGKTVDEDLFLVACIVNLCRAGEAQDASGLKPNANIFDNTMRALLSKGDEGMADEFAPDDSEELLNTLKKKAKKTKKSLKKVRKKGVLRKIAKKKSGKRKKGRKGQPVWQKRLSVLVSATRPRKGKGPSKRSLERAQRQAKLVKKVHGMVKKMQKTISLSKGKRKGKRKRNKKKKKRKVAKKLMKKLRKKKSKKQAKKAQSKAKKTFIQSKNLYKEQQSTTH